MRKIFFIGILLIGALSFAPVVATAATLEYPSIYKSTRAMGMGGAYTAVGGRVDSLFYNPAGLINIPQDKGWEVNGFPIILPLNISVEASKNVKNFIDDMSDATDKDKHPTDADQLQAMNDVLAKYRGEELHLRIADFPSVGKSYDKWAFGVGGLASGRMDALTHQGFGSDGLLELNADAMYGGLGGFSINVAPNVYVGLSAKYLHREAIMHEFTARELVDHQDDLSGYIKNDLLTKGNAFGFDTGVIWKFSPNSPLKPAFGASIMNIGDLDFKNAGTIPQSVNVGLSFNPSVSWSRSLIVAVDYVDILNNYKQDKDMAKRLRYGAELQLFDITPVELALRAGMYEGSPTLGLDFRLTVITISYAMYTEELGAYAGQDKNKRQLLTLNIGW